MDRADEAGGDGGLPWARVFDPAANIRALSAIQADGLRAASDLVDRFVRMAAQGLNGLGEEAKAATADSRGDMSGDLYGATGLEPLATSLWSMFDQFLRVSAPLHGVVNEQSESATLDMAASRAEGEVRLQGVPPCTATTEVWLHNAGSTDVGKVRLRCSDLLMHDGTVMPASALRLEPDIVPLPARSSRGVTVEVEVGEGAEPGSYRGMLLADGHPDIWVPIRLSITSRTS